MTHYEKVTREEIARRNYTEGTTRAYLRARQDRADYFHQPPEWLAAEQIREYAAHLISHRKLSGNTVNQMVGALALVLSDSAEQTVAGAGDALPEEEYASARHPESGRSRTTDRRCN